MEKKVEINGITLSPRLIDEISILQDDNHATAKFYSLQLCKIMGLIANSKNQQHEFTDEQLLQFVGSLSDINNLLVYITD